jgi:hypothetical protein
MALNNENALHRIHVTFPESHGEFHGQWSSAASTS